MANFEQKIDWFYLEKSEYISLTPDSNGIIKSKIYPGLWLDITALLEGNMTQILAILQTGLNSPEYQILLQNLS
ncbi:MAG TPA: hypothetical protein VK184_11410 [Nostocaceae cyanobacterium]|nr:hypothetical protein [Nostocaceae cyanobacterium]